MSAIQEPHLTSAHPAPDQPIAQAVMRLLVLITIAMLLILVLLPLALTAVGPGT